MKRVRSLLLRALLIALLLVPFTGTVATADPGTNGSIVPQVLPEDPGILPLRLPEDPGLL
ncbi:MAG TPA: hypothetical protein VJQ09_01430 [Candidatus Limnocylindria bacterium]|nr:hypothetical protein [Candidatus Limnocylindria bacterium]